MLHGPCVLFTLKFKSLSVCRLLIVYEVEGNIRQSKFKGFGINAAINRIICWVVAMVLCEFFNETTWLIVNNLE